MKVLLITDGIPPETLGGAGRIVLETAMGMHKRGHEVTLVTTAKETGEEVRDGVRIVRLPQRGKRWMHYLSVFSQKRAQEILQIIDEVRPDVIHGHVLAWQCGYRWIYGARGRGIPCLVTAHDVSHIAYGKVVGDETALWFRDARRFRWSWNPVRNIMIRRALSKCHKVLCVSDALKKLMAKYGVRHLETLHNGIDLTQWKNTMSQEEARMQLSIPTDACVFLLAGRLGPDKGTLLLKETLPKDAHILVAGDGELDTFTAWGDRLHVYTRQSGEKMKILYCASDVALVPSLCFDCFPTVNLEAMACERAVIATTRGGSKESVVDGTTGWILDPLDTTGWRDRMAWCVAHRGELLAYGKRGRERVEQKFGLAIYLASLEQHYAAAIKKHH